MHAVDEPKSRRMQGFKVHVYDIHLRTHTLIIQIFLILARCLIEHILMALFCADEYRNIYF